jgi:hypothetical protein
MAFLSKSVLTFGKIFCIILDMPGSFHCESKWLRKSMRLFSLLLFIFLSGCTMLGRPQQPLGFLRQFSVTFTPTPAFSTLAPVLLTGTPAASETPTAPANCEFVLASHEQPAVTDLVNKAFQAAGLASIEGRAAAYGEDCLDTNTKNVAGFSAMQTDVYVNITLPGTNDPQVMGEWVEKVVRALDTIPPSQLPGPNPGDIGISFQNGSQQVDLWFPREKAQSLINQGTKGSDLFDALNNS